MRNGPAGVRARRPARRAVRESRERVRAALANSGFEFPQQRITANLAPADLRKAGPGFDLAIAAAVLAATGQLPERRARRRRARRRARARRLDPGGPRDAGDGRGRAPRGRPGDRRPGRVRRPRRRWSPAARVDPGRSGSSSCASSAATPSRPPPEALRPSPNGAPPAARPRRPARPAGPAAGARGRRRRRPQPADQRAARARASRWRRGGCPRSCRRSGRARRSRRRGWRARAGGRSSRRSPAGARSGRPHHTISTAGLIGGGNPPRAGRGDARPPRRPLPRRAAGVRPRARSRRCASRSRTARCGSSAPATRSSCRAASSSSPRPTRVRAGAGRAPGSCTCDPAAVRAYEAKLTGALADRIDISLPVEQPDLGLVRRARARARPRSATGCWPRASASGLGRGGDRANAELRADGDRDSAPRSSACSPRPGRRAGLSGRGRERVIRLARTIADLDGRRSDRASSTSRRRSRCAVATRMSRPPWPGRSSRAARRPTRRALTDLDAGERPPLLRVGDRSAARVGSTSSGGDDRRLAQRRAATGCGSPSGSARDLALAGVTVVSGMALGIDAAAHRGALDGGGGDGRGARRRPRRRLPGRQREPAPSGSVERGAAISEHPPGTAVRRHHFPARNRIMAALSARSR